jgi:hypothetical protein
MNTRSLRLISIGYLMIPVLIFLANWFRPEYSVIFIFGHLLFFAFYWMRALTKDETFISLKVLASLSVIALIWTFLTGVGGFFLQTTDYVGHNSKFFDLYAHHWPILFPEKHTFSCYYYGYYLIPAIFFKLIGGISVPIILLHTWLGIFLGLVWLYLLLFRNMYFLCIFIICGGVLFSSELISLSLFRFTFSFNPVWSLFFQSIYVPNQTISVLITAGIFLYYMKDYRLSFYLITLSFYWGVFPAAMLVILFGLNFIGDVFIDKNFPGLKSFLVNYVVPCILFLPTFVFLTSSKQLPVHGFYSFNSLGLWVPYIEVILLLVLIISLLRSMPDGFSGIPLPIVFAALLMLSLLLTFRLGTYNDLFYRGSMPLFFIILLYIFQIFISKVSMDLKAIGGKPHFLKLAISSPFLKRYLLVIGWIALGCSASLYQMGRMVQRNTFLKTYTPAPYNKFANSYQALIKLNGVSDANQYLGDPQSFYFVHLAPKSE